MNEYCSISTSNILRLFDSNFKFNAKRNIIIDTKDGKTQVIIASIKMHFWIQTARKIRQYNRFEKPLARNKELASTQPLARTYLNNSMLVLRSLKCYHLSVYRLFSQSLQLMTM